MIDMDLVAILERIGYHYPDHYRLTERRLVYTVFLLDWRNALLYRQQATPILWSYSEAGPWSDSIMATIRSHPEHFLVDTKLDSLGQIKTTVSSTRPRRLQTFLSPQIEDVLNFVLDKTVRLSWSEFLDEVYSTYPIRTQAPTAAMDLGQIARWRNKEKQVG